MQINGVIVNNVPASVTLTAKSNMTVAWNASFVVAHPSSMRVDVAGSVDATGYTGKGTFDPPRPDSRLAHFWTRDECD